nr:hypothetical protein [Tanacetum cinerariifolium]
MHNNIMAAGSRDRLPMLTTGRYPQWRSRFLRYIDIRPNSEALRKYILSSPYKPTTVLVQAVEETDDSPAVLEHTTVKTPMNMSSENKDHFLAEKEAVHLILTGIGDEIYSTVDACQTTQKISHTATRHKGKEIAKQIMPPSETASKEENNPEQAQKDKDMQKNLALIAKYFKKIYKPTNNLRTSSNSKNKNVDTTPWFKNDNHSGQFGNQRMECRKPKRVKDFAYHKEKMLLCKQAEQGVPFQAKHYDWLADTDKEVDEQELEAHYSYMAKIQEVPTADSGTDSEPVDQIQNDAGYNVFSNNLQHFEQSKSVSNTCLVETDDSNVSPDSPDMCEDDIQNEQNDVESDDERVALANFIANLKLNVDENKKIQKQLKKANTTLAQELKECKAILAKTSKSLGESISVRDSFLVALQTKQTEFKKYKAFNERTIDYDKLKLVKQKYDELMIQTLLTKSHYEGLVKQKIKVITDLKLREEHDIEKMLSMEKQLKFLNEIVYKRNQSIQTIHMIARKEIDELKSDKAEFSDMYDVILQECVSNDVKCSYLQSLSDLDVLDEFQYTLAELQCMYLHKVKECECLAQKLSKQTESVSKKVHTELLQRFAKVEQHSISLEISLQKGKEHVKNDTVCNEKASNVFRKEREQYFEIQDLKAQMQDKNIAISELKKLIEKSKEKYVDTKFDRPSVVRQPDAQRIPKPSVLVTGHNLPQTARQAVSNTNVLKPGMYKIDNRTSHTRAPQLPQTIRNTNPRVSTST